MKISAAEGAEIITAIFQDGEPSEEEGEELNKLRTVVTCWRQPDLTVADSRRILALYHQIVGEQWDTSLDRPEREMATRAKLKVNDTYTLSCDSHGWTLTIQEEKKRYNRYYTSLEAACLSIADHAGRDALSKVDNLLQVITAIQCVKDDISTALDRLTPPVPCLRAAPPVEIKRRKRSEHTSDHQA